MLLKTRRTDRQDRRRNGTRRRLLALPLATVPPRSLTLHLCAAGNNLKLAPNIRVMHVSAVARCALVVDKAARTTSPTMPTIG